MAGASVSRSFHNLPRRYPGLTVIELLVTLLVVGILAGVGLPALTELVLDARMTAGVNGLVHAVHLAKQEAHKRATYVAICPSGDGRQCVGP